MLPSCQTGREKFVFYFRFVMSKLLCDRVRWNQSLKLCKNYFRLKVTLLLWSWSVPPSLRKLSDFPTQMSETWCLCIFLHFTIWIEKAAVAVALGCFRIIALAQSLGRKIGFLVIIKAVTFSNHIRIFPFTSEWIIGN